MLDSLLSASLKLGNASYLLRIPRFILDDGERDAVQWVISYYRKYKVMPTTERLKRAGHGAYLTDYLVDSPIEDLFDTMMNQKRDAFFFSQVRSFEEKIDSGDHLSTEDVIGMGRQLAQIRREEHVSILEIDRDDMYEGEEDGPGLTFGFKAIDAVTNGLYNGEFGLLVARTGVGKTMVTCFLAHRWFASGKKVLFLSMEQTPKQVTQRIDGIIGSFNPNWFRLARGSKALAEKKAFVQDQVAGLKARGGDLIFPKRRKITVESLYSLIEDHEPDVVIVDGIYLMRSSEASGATADWQKLKMISNELKQLSLEYDIPIFATSQLKRTGKEDSYSTEDIAYSDALSQDTDLILVAHKAGAASDEIVLEMMKNRNGESLAGAIVKFDWDKMYVHEGDWTAIKAEAAHA